MMVKLGHQQHGKFGTLFWALRNLGVALTLNPFSIAGPW